MNAAPARIARARGPAAWLAAVILALGLADPAAAESGRSILDLQPFRSSERIEIREAGGRAGEATLLALNPRINAWFLLTLAWADGGAARSYHLENADPLGQRLRLLPDGIEVVEAGGDALRLEPDGLPIAAGGARMACELWPGALERAADSGLPFAPLCDGRLYLRNAVTGHRTDLERVAEFLRDRVWGGEAIVGFVRESLFRDAFAEHAEAAPAVVPGAGPPGAPSPAAIDAAFAGQTVAPAHLGIEVGGAEAGRLGLGRWYAATGIDGVHLSVIQPRAVARAILESDPERANPLDAVEGGALATLVAFDLARFELGFALGTEHPRLDWSSRPSDAVRTALPGPDGMATAAPLVRTGIVSPAVLGRTVATFTGGFKRSHGAFKYGELATVNRGSHYGFIEEGVVFSRLQPGLATLMVTADGRVDMRPWSATEEAGIAGIRHARQNGVALVEPDPAGGRPRPGPLVARWGPGNWSGSAAGELRALRAGACLVETDARRFLVYGYFSTATPSAMARVFQAYGCAHAMLLDMNALEHTYLALYRRRGDEIQVQHLHTGMAEVDRAIDQRMAPRFIGFPDNRDFFTVLRRKDSR